MNQQGSYLQKEEIGLIRFFRDNPWFYTVFSIDKELYNDFYQVLNYSDGSNMILYSPSIKKLLERGARLFSALLFFNGDCYQTYGNIHYYKAFQPFDFDYFFKMLIPQYYKENDISASIAFRPLHFLLLDNWSEIPTAVHGKEIVTQCCHVVRYKSFDVEKYREKFNIEKKKGVTRLRLKRSKLPFNISELYLDEEKKKMLLFASGIKRYKKLVRLIEEEIELPEFPDYYATVSMVAAVNEMLGKSFPVAEYESIFEATETSNINSNIRDKELKKVNAFMKELIKRSNTGTSYSLPELAKLYDLPMETAIQLDKMVTKIDDRFKIDIDGGLRDFIPPPPVIRREFRNTLAENRIFAVDTSIDFSADKLSTKELYDKLENISRDYWRNGTRTVLLYTFYMLCKKGHHFEKVRDYAVELLKTFWQIILPNKKKKTLEDFIERYTRYISDVFYGYGLVEIDKQENNVGSFDNSYSAKVFSIKASEFFNRWIKLSDYFKD